MKHTLLKMTLSVWMLVLMVSNAFAQGSGPYQFVETFETLGLTGTIYRDGSFTGVNQITWDYTHVTGEQSFPITNEGILLRRSGENSSIKSSLISGGISNFKVDMRKAFTGAGDRQIGLFINNQLIASSVTFGNFSGGSDEIISFEVNDINIEGDFTLEIRHLLGGTQNRQLVIDNISWNAFGTTVTPIEQTATPVITPNGGIFDTVQNVSITASTSGASIYYTLDGSVPSINSTLYTGPISIEASATLSAIALADGFSLSDVSSADFTINLPSLPAASLPYSQSFSGFVFSNGTPVTSFGTDSEWSFTGTAINYTGNFLSTLTAGGFRGNDNVLGYQHTGSTGVFVKTVTLTNTTGNTITSLDIAYLGRVARASEGRSPAYTVRINDTVIPELAYSTSGGVEQRVAATIAGLSIAPNERFTISWSSERGSGVGSSRVIGLADLSVKVTPTPINFVEWNFTGAPGNQLLTSGNALAPGIQARDFVRGSGVNPSNAANSISANGWNAGEDRFFSFGFTIAPDKLVDLKTLQIGSTSSNTGPRDFALVYSGDGFTRSIATWQHTGSFVNQVIDLSELQNLSGNVEFRIIPTSTVSANGGTIASTGTARVTNFFPGGLPVTFNGLVKESAGVLIPSLSINPEILSFGLIAVNSSSSTLSYQLTGSNLTGDVTITAPNRVSISRDGISFVNQLIVPAAELTIPVTIQVRFNTATVGAFNGAIIHSTTGTLPISLQVTASVFDPFNITEDFNNSCVANLGPLDGVWNQVSVTGDQTWSCSNFGRAGTSPTASAPFGVQINGFAAGSARDNEDWLISPSYDLTAFDFPLLQFWSRVAFTGPRLKLKVSTDYVSGDPNLATWTELADRFAQSDVWTNSGEINLAAFKNSNVRIAIVYTSSPELGASRWTFDDFSLRNSENPPAPFLANSIGNVDYWHFGIVPIGNSSTQTRTFEFSLSDAIADLTIAATDGFEFSKDGINFSSSLVFTPQEAGITSSVTIRFTPTRAGAFSSPIFFSSGDIQVRRGYLTGSTVERSKTLDIVTWNVEWFGSSTNGPSNVALQLENVKKVIEDLDADIYAFQEITSLARFNELAAALPQYGAVVSPAASSGSGTFEEDAQKLTYLFKKSTVDTLQTKVLLKGVTPELLVGYPSGRDRFWASGRLPYLMEIQTKKNGTRKTINLVNVHTRSNGGGESAANPRYAMRKYDVNVLKDTLDAYYANVPLIILGDFNDDLDETVADANAPTVGTTETSFINYINDVANYNPITISLSNAGLRTFPSFENVIDHMIISNEMNESWVTNSERIYFPYDLIPNYNSTTSDHLPVKARFELICDLEVPQIIGPDALCIGADGSLFLIGGNYQSIIVWESSTDGSTWAPIAGSQGVDILSLASINERTFFRVIVSNDSCFPQVSEAFELAIKTLPTPVIFFSNGLLQTIQGPYTYRWFKNGVQFASGSANTARINGAGIYQVEIRDAEGCTALSTTYRFPQQLTGNQVRVFPNPATNQVTVTLRNVEGVSNIQLKTSFGSIVNQVSSSDGIAQFDLSGLAKGVYLVVITNQHTGTIVERLVIR
jgi:endonuclease/exonuclease/phosphatase family metal-dependent hydrolase